MKKLFSVGVAMAFAVSLLTVASAARMAGPAKSVEHAQAAAPGKSAGAVKQAEPAKKAVAGKGEKRRQITGVVKAIDEDAGTLTVQGRKGSVSLKAGEKVKLKGIMVGDRVLSMYSGGTASSVRKIAAGKVAAGKK
ncbi:MAG TPA: hypothetical protein VK944_02910 [Candidatus Limnocylindria bacterium]|nr:hypothetical protein [Candidatus Limnocylindria bacterium]